jgi:tetratricopeptide (TPR) repeat protein
MKRRGLQSASISDAAGKLGVSSAWTNETQLQSAEISLLDQKWIRTVVLFLTFVTFLPALENGFVDIASGMLGDRANNLLLANRDSKLVLTGTPFGAYHPILWSTFAFDHRLWWMDPFGYHLTSLLLHIGNAVMVYSIASFLIAYSRLFQSSDVTIAEKLAAALATLIFAIHPLRVEPVAWVSARAELLSSLWGLLSIYAYLRAKAASEAHPRALFLMRLSIFTYACSLVSGPAGLFLPIVLLLLDVYPLHRAQRFPSPFRANDRKLYYEKTRYVLVAVCWMIVTIVAGDNAAALVESYASGAFERILHQLAAPAFYLWKFAIPLALSPSQELNGSAAAAFAATSILLCVGAFAAYGFWRASATAWFSYAVLLWTHYRVDSAGQQILADRYSYLALIPLAIIAGAALVHWAVVFSKQKRWRSAVAVGTAVTIVAAFVLLTRYRLPMWRDAETLWKKTVATTASSHAYFNLAMVSESHGKFDDAVTYYRRAAELNPQRWDAHERAADLLQQRGKINDAAEHYRRVVQSRPRALKSRENLAAGLVNLGNIPEAIKHLRIVLDLAPERNDVRVKLGTILAVEGRVHEAAHLFRTAAEQDPADGRHFLRLGQVLAAQGRLPEAVENFREAVRLRPADAEAHESLGKALAESGRRDEAAAHLREALNILRSTPTER